MNAIKNLTVLQWIGIVLLVNSVLTSSTNEMKDLLGAVWATHAVSLATIGSGICGGLVTMFGGISSQASNVAALPGVDRILVNRNANATLSALAVDHDQPKIGPAKPEDRAVLVETAKVPS
jgi:hypothetical protein